MQRAANTLRLNPCLSICLCILCFGYAQLGFAAQAPSASSATQPGVGQITEADSHVPDATTDHKPVFEEWGDGPPPGFEDVNQPETVDVKVFYASRYLGMFEASYTEDWIAFAHPEKIVAQLSQVKNRKAIQQALTGQLESHAARVCHQDRDKKQCGFITPDIAGVIFNISNYHVDLFLGMKVVARKGKLEETYFEEPNTALSVISSLNVLGSGTKVGATQTSSYTLNIKNSISKQRHNVQLNGVLTDQEPFAMTALYGESLLGKRSLRYGLIDLASSPLLGGETIIGVSYQSSEKELANREQMFGVPVEVFLTLPSTVNVYRGNEMIYTRRFPVGHHYLDTRQFPTGAYMIRIEITNFQGGVRNKNQYFVKRPSMPRMGKDQFSLSIGEIESTTDITGLFPKGSGRWIYSARRHHRVNHHLAVGAGLTGGGSFHYVSTDMRYIGETYSMNAALMASLTKDYGLSAGFSGTLLGGRLTSGFRLVHHQPQPQGLVHYAPIAQSSEASWLLYSRSMLGLDISTSLTYLKADGAVTRTVSARTGGALFSVGKIRAGWALELVKENQKTDYLLSMSLGHVSQNGSERIDTLYQLQSERNLAPTTDLNSQMTVDRVFRWNRYGLTGRLIQDNKDRNLQLQASAATNIINGVMTLSRTQAFGSSTPTDQYNVDLRSALAWTDGHFDMAGTVEPKAGVLVLLTTEGGATSAQDEFNIMDNQETKVIAAPNDPEFLASDPLIEHHYRIKPADNANFYEYDSTPQSVLLYPGNIQKMIWRLRRQYLLFARLIDEQGQPIADAEEMAEGSFNFTDEFGDLQAEIYQDQRTLRFLKVNGTVCEVQIPDKLHVVDGYVQVDALPCRALNKATEAA